MGISYRNVLLLRDVWAMHDIEQCSACPNEIAEGKPNISIIDNDDFLNDTLTGAGAAHCCNWMFLQRVDYLSSECNADKQVQITCSKDTKTLSHILSKKSSEMQVVKPYKTISRGQPPIRPKPVAMSSSTEHQFKCRIIHALARADENGNRLMHPTRLSLLTMASTLV